MAKKRGKKKKAATVGMKPKRRGGRKPGTWTLTNPDELRAFRASTKTSRARLADMMGVSVNSVANWESGTTATTKLQARLAEIIKGGVAAAPAPTVRRSKSGKAAPTPTVRRTAGVLASTAAPGTTDVGTIIAAYLASQGRVMSTAELGALIRTVRAALG